MTLSVALAFRGAWLRAFAPPCPRGGRGGGCARGRLRGGGGDHSRAGAGPSRGRADCPGDRDMPLGLLNRDEEALSVGTRELTGGHEVLEVSRECRSGLASGSVPARSRVRADGLDV